MMYEELYQFLIQEEKLNVPGIGTFSMNRKSAEVDFINKNIHPPVYEITLQEAQYSNPRKLFSWLATANNISEGEAVIQFSNFAFEMKKQIISGNEIKWNGVGILMKDHSGEIILTPSYKNFVEESVQAEKIIREHTDHTILVGENERTTVEMTEFFTKTEEKKPSWWNSAIFAGVIAVMFIGWYFSEHGLKSSSVGYQKKLIPQVTESTYNSLH